MDIAPLVLNKKICVICLICQVNKLTSVIMLLETIGLQFFYRTWEETQRILDLFLLTCTREIGEKETILASL